MIDSALEAGDLVLVGQVWGAWGWSKPASARAVTARAVTCSSFAGLSVVAGKVEIGGPPGA